MYKAMLSYEQLKGYLVMLTENDLIVYDKPSGKFTTSDKGYQFLKGYEYLSKLIGPIATIIAKEETDSSIYPIEKQDIDCSRSFFKVLCARGFKTLDTSA